MIVRVLRFVVLSFALLTVFTAFAPALHAQEADLLVQKSGPTEAAADTDVAYTVTVTNLGPDDAPGVTLNDNIPAGMTFVSETQDSGPVFACVTPAVGAGGAITCTNALLTAGSAASFTFTVHIDAGTPPGTSFTNIATVTSQIDPNSENDSATVVTTTPPPPQSDVFVIKDGPGAAPPDSDVTYTITIGNAGPAAAENVNLTDTLPGTMEFVSLTQNSGPALTCTTPAAASTGGQSSCTAATFLNGATATFTLVGHIPAGTPSGTTFTNTANIVATNDPEGSNDSSTTSLIVSSVDVGVTKNGAATASAGTDIAYTLTVTNTGADTATTVSLSDPLPPDTTFVSLTADNAAAMAAACGTPLAGSSGTVTCTFPTGFPASATAQFTMTIHIGNTTSITNTVTVTTGSFDTNPANDSDSVTTAVTPSNDVTVTKTGPAAVVAGQNATYTIDVTNNGPSTAGVSLSDTLPAGTTFAGLAFPPGWSCTTPIVNAAGTVTCDAAVLNPGVTASFTLAVNVAASVAAGSTIVNTATITVPNDPNAGNNSSTTTAATVSASADVDVTKTGPAAVSPDTDITYTVTVTNAGPSDAAGVSLSDTLPANTTFVSATQTDGPTFACTPPPVGGTGTLTCTIATLDAGATATFSLVLHVDPATPVGSTIANTATVSSTTPDPNGANGSATSNAAVAPGVTDVRITKTANQPQLATGSNATYTITVTNDGPAIAIDAVVSDTLPAGTTFQSATPSQGTCSGTTTVTCSLGNLNAGAAATITLVVTLPSTPGPVENTATVTSANVDSNPANNTSSTTIAVSPAQAVPTLSEWMLLVMALALAVVGLRSR
jgi:uncharacterized repeat protein (TIGR01451 family)